MTAQLSPSDVTFSLEISFPDRDIKDQVCAWLPLQGYPQFVEGYVDGLDIAWNAGSPDEELFGEMAGDSSPVLLYSYHENELSLLAEKLHRTFAHAGVHSCIQGIRTQAWQEGWRDSFRPISAGRFYVTPPWDSSISPDAQAIPLVIEPGMAFGTGQHATTTGCLTLLSSLAGPRHSFFDVGTGTGILALAAHKLGFSVVDACDIDKEAILAAKDNFARNGCHTARLWEGGIEASPFSSYDVICANILLPILVQLMPSFNDRLKSSGFLIVSGILASQKHELELAAAPFGLKTCQQIMIEDWVSLVMTRPKVDPS